LYTVERYQNNIRIMTLTYSLTTSSDHRYWIRTIRFSQAHFT